MLGLKSKGMTNQIVNKETEDKKINNRYPIFLNIILTPI